MSSELDVRVDNFMIVKGIATATMKVTNRQSKDAAGIVITCAFLNSSKKAVAIDYALIDRISAGDYRYTDSTIPNASAVEYVDCRLTKMD